MYGLYTCIRYKINTRWGVYYKYKYYIVRFTLKSDNCVNTRDLHDYNDIVFIFIFWLEKIYIQILKVMNITVNLSGSL